MTFVRQSYILSMCSRIRFVSGMDRMGGGGRGGRGRGGIDRIVGEIGRDGMRYGMDGWNENEGGDGDNEGVGPVEVGIFQGGRGRGEEGERITPIFIIYFF